ncbi:MAG: hypothetical protein CM1200mP29_02560 [Verrucomicrobiota bacterium]|nr:MAG: hypothetical protein CM1200mP29_02560 [Verrucomicrobiota bacterium]
MEIALLTRWIDNPRFPTPTLEWPPAPEKKRTPSQSCPRSLGQKVTDEPMLRLGVNIDHVATLRQARYRGFDRGEPCPLMPSDKPRTPARMASRRIYVRIGDTFSTATSGPSVTRCRRALTSRWPTRPGMIDIATRLKPEAVCLVPENRAEVTTEGGLDVVGQVKPSPRAPPRLAKPARGELLSIPTRSRSRPQPGQAALLLSYTLAPTPKLTATKPDKPPNSSAWPGPPSRPSRLDSASTPATA